MRKQIIFTVLTAIVLPAVGEAQSHGHNCDTDASGYSYTISTPSGDSRQHDFDVYFNNVVDLVKPRFSGQAASVGFNDVLASESFQSAASSCFRRLRLRSCWLSSASLLR